MEGYKKKCVSVDYDETCGTVSTGSVAEVANEVQLIYVAWHAVLVESCCPAGGAFSRYVYSRFVQSRFVNNRYLMSTCYCYLISIVINRLFIAYSWLDSFQLIRTSPRNCRWSSLRRPRGKCVVYIWTGSSTFVGGVGRGTRRRESTH